MNDLRVVGSLTTLPKRLIFLKTTLISIQNQSYSLDLLYLNIPYETKKGEKYVIPDDLLENIDIPVEINRCKDVGSITKILPTLSKEKDPETIIITFDDDVEYGSDLVSNLVQKAAEDSDVCVGTGGWIVGNFPFMFQFVHDVHERTVDWLEGKSAVAYRRKFLNEEELLNFDIPLEFSQHDDHIISAVITMNGAKKIVIDGRKTISGRANVSGINSISGDGLNVKFFKEVYKISMIMKQKGLYTEKADVHKTVGFYLFIILLVIVVMITFIAWYRL